MGRNMWHCRTPGFCRTPQITACSLGSLLCSPMVTPRLFWQFLESTCLDIESKGWCWGPLCSYSKVAPAQQHLLWFSTVDLLGLHWKTLGREQQGWAAWQLSLCTPAREGQNLSFSLREAVAEELLWEGSEYDAVPSPGDGADAVQEQPHGAPLLSGGQQNWDPFCASARVPPPARYFKLHTAEGSGRFLVT